MTKKPADWHYDPNSCFWFGFVMGLIPFFVTMITILARL